MIKDDMKLSKQDLLFRALTILGAVILYIFAAYSAHAGQNFEFYRGIRQMGMGGASIAVVNDETALLANPAGLGKLRDYIITVADPEVDVGSKTQAIIGTGVTKVLEPQETLDLINDGHQNKPLYLRAQVFPSLVVPNFGVGVFKKYEISATVDTTANTYRYDYINDTAVVLGYNFRFWDGRIKIGFSGRFVNRAEAHEAALDPASAGLTLDSMVKEGFGAAADAGIILSAPWKMLPTLAAVYRDVGNTHYNVNDGLFFNATERPVNTVGTLDVAMAVFPIIGKRTRSTFTVEYRDILTASDETDVNRRYHAGIEFNFADAVFLRGGYNQRYWTYGLEFSMGNYQFQAASYGEEVGTVDAPKEERHYNLKFSYRF
ncbi:MAG: hypothetical protein H6624_10470 [Bdellovibrionaceae bacterium]|nr:hypothetical protein [Bdellovibrionales bacterium]MCB9084759.1 hypothetical protein [Pseudobdellovibrionaceae bacterium]